MHTHVPQTPFRYHSLHQKDVCVYMCVCVYVCYLFKMEKIRACMDACLNDNSKDWKELGEREETSSRA